MAEQPEIHAKRSSEIPKSAAIVRADFATKKISKFASVCTASDQGVLVVRLFGRRFWRHNGLLCKNDRSFDWFHHWTYFVGVFARSLLLLAS